MSQNNCLCLLVLCIACAQFGILDTETTGYEHVCVPYDFKAEQELYTDEVDVFYRDRLTLGI